MDKLLVQKTNPLVSLPTRTNSDDAGLDLCAAESILLSPLQRHAVKTGIRIALPAGTEGQIRSRSGLALEHGVAVLNSPGTIDPGYRGEIAVILVNLGAEAFEVEAGMRIAQLVISPVLYPTVVETFDLPEGSRGPSGFGSSGV